jgi:hypothetical protein
MFVPTVRFDNLTYKSTGFIYSPKGMLGPSSLCNKSTTQSSISVRKGVPPAKVATSLNQSTRLSFRQQPTLWENSFVPLREVNKLGCLACLAIA